MPRQKTPRALNPNPPKIGAPSKFTKATVLTILECVRKGMTKTGAAAMAGIDRTTLRDWEKWATDSPEQGDLIVPEGCTLPNVLKPWLTPSIEDMRIAAEAEIELDVPELPDSDYSGTPFPVALARARDEFESAQVYAIQHAAQRASKVTYHYGQGGRLLRKVEEYDWKAAQALLERHPELRKVWAPPKAVELSGPDGAPLQGGAGVTVVTWSPDEKWLEEFAKAAAEAGVTEKETGGG